MNQQISASLAELPGFPMAATKPSANHSRKCSVCRHPDRIWIELKFIEWYSPTRIDEEFDLSTTPTASTTTPTPPTSTNYAFAISSASTNTSSSGP
jgi:hypothetical protein